MSSSRYVVETRSDSGQFLFMFVRRDVGLYVLYKIDAIGLYRSLKKDDDLLPLIVFEPDLLPADCDCAFAYIDPFFYVVGQNKRDVFTINKNRLLKLVPSKNYRGRKFVKQIAPMFRDKLAPLAFAYDNQLYVVSKSCADSPYLTFNKYDFELYSPSTHSWSALGTRPSQNCEIKSYVIIDKIVYFTTSIQTVMSFNLEAVHWSTVYDPYGYDYFDQNNVVTIPTFDTQIQKIGDTVFGGVYQPGHKTLYFCPSHTHPFSDLFLRPSLDQDKCSLVTSSCSFSDITKVDSLCSSYTVTMDLSEDIACVVCYGSDLSSSGVSSYARLSFFKVSQGYHPSCSSTPPVEGQTCGSLLSSLFEEEGQRASSLKLDCIHRTHLRITTKKNFTRGIVSSCFVV